MPSAQISAGRAQSAAEARRGFAGQIPREKPQNAAQKRTEGLQSVSAPHTTVRTKAEPDAPQS